MPAWEAYAGCREDLVERWREEIARRAQALHDAGENGDAEANWLRAEAEVLREKLKENGTGAA